MLLHKPLKIKRPPPIRLTHSSHRKRAFGLIFWISDYRRCRCYGVCDVVVEREKREQPYPDGFPNMAVLICCTPVWQLPCVSIISILSYWKLPDPRAFVFSVFADGLLQINREMSIMGLDADENRKGAVKPAWHRKRDGWKKSPPWMRISPNGTQIS